MRMLSTRFITGFLLFLTLVGPLKANEGGQVDTSPSAIQKLTKCYGITIQRDVDEDPSEEYQECQGFFKTIVTQFEQIDFEGMKRKFEAQLNELKKSFSSKD